MPRAVKIAAGSIAVGGAVLAIKLLAWWLTGSVALLSDALESIVNVATAIAAFVAVRIAVQPADADHPFGHHKAEYFSAVMEGVMIVVAAILILNEAWGAWNAPRDIDAPFTGLLLIGLASVVNGIWAIVLMREGRSLRSPALEADGRHLMTDVVSSAGVLRRDHVDPKGLADRIIGQLPRMDVQPFQKVRIIGAGLFPTLIGQRQHEGHRRVAQSDGRGPGDRAGHVGHAIVHDAVNFVNWILMGGRLRRLETATLVNRHVYQRRARFHRGEIGAFHQLGRSGAGDQHGADHQGCRRRRRRSPPRGQG